MKLITAQLTKTELSFALEIVHRSLHVSTDQDLCALLTDLQNLVPCDSVVAGLGRTNRRGDLEAITKLLNHSYPGEWMSLYVEKGFAAVDPVVQAHLKGYRPQIWSHTYRRARTRDERIFIQHAKGYGLHDGITVGAPCRRHAGGSLFSFSGRFLSSHPRHTALLSYFAPHLHLALMRTAFQPPRDIPALSDREWEVLQWIKEGKTNWEISQILRISERTAKFHVRNLMLKLDVNRRSHAVAIALERGLIGLDSTN